MKVLMVHNFHRSGSSSGDDVVFKKEVELLEKNGHKVVKINPSNDDYDNSNIFKKILTVFQIPWSIYYYNKIKKIINQEQPDIIHVHNFFPIISPSIFYAAQAMNVPIIQTLHDFRYLCPMAFFLRKGKICKECINGNFFRSIQYGCFKDSKLKSIMPALMNQGHYYLKTYKEKIDGYICLTESQRKIFLDSGFDESKIFIKPNFVEDTFVSKIYKTGDYIVFIGRLGEEKGLQTLIYAWKSISEIPLKIIGDGPDASKFKELAINLNAKNIEFLGYIPHKECMNILSKSRFLIMPSISYETFGLAIVEAFCHYKPVIASNLGAMADIVKDGETGLLFEPGNPDDLTQKVQCLWNNPDECRRMGANARKEYKKKYTPEKNYKMLMNIYQKVITTHR